MNFPRKPWRVCLAVGACALVAQSRVAAEMPPEVTAQCTDFLNKVNAARRKDLDKTMADEIAAVTKATGLGPEGVKALEAAAAIAEDAAQADMVAKGLSMYTKAYSRSGGRGLGDFSRPEVIEAATRSDSNFDTALHYTHAPDQAAWTDALAHTLSPEQSAAWQKAHVAKLGEVPKEYEDMIEKQAEQARTNLSTNVTTRTAEIISTLDLPKDRADAVTALANQALDASLDAWRQDARRLYLHNDEASRKRLLRGRMAYAQPREEDAPENQAVWTDGLAKVLTADERATLAVSRTEQRKRRTHALAMLMLALLDERVAFTADQRPKVEPILEQLVQKNDEFYPQLDRNNEYFSLNPASFYKATAGAKEKDIRPVLDDLQWKRWQDTSRDKGQGNDEEEEAQPSPSASPSPAAIEEPEDLESMVSAYVAVKSAGERRRIDTAMLLQAEDAARVAGLPPATVARLRTAALGAAEAALAEWSLSVEETVRGQVQGADRETIQQRLSSSNRYYFSPATPKEQAVWKQAVKSDLTAEQQAAWQKERDARAQYADDAVAQFLLAEFDRNFVLNADQWARFGPPLAKALHDYRPDINRMFSYDTSKWFLTSYYMFLPVHAIPEDDCKAIVGKDRYDRWLGSSGFRYSAQYWSSLKQYHEQRLQEEKK